MSDLGKLDLGDWLSLAVISVGGGMSAAMGWFRSSNKKRDEKTAALEVRMQNYEAVRADQATQLAVIEACQETIKETLAEIKDDIQHTAERGAHSVNTQLAAVMTEVQKIAAHQQRRT